MSYRPRRPATGAILAFQRRHAGPYQLAPTGVLTEDTLRVISSETPALARYLRPRLDPSEPPLTRGQRDLVDLLYAAARWRAGQRTPHPLPPKVGRNAPCPCGSSRKFKACHGRDRFGRPVTRYAPPAPAKGDKEGKGAA